MQAKKSFWDTPVPDVPKKPPNALQLVADYLDVPFYALGAARRGGGEEFSKVFHGLAPDKIQDIADRYNLFSPEQLQIESQKGDPFAGFFLKHPKIAGAAQFGAEFLNPSNVLLNPVVGGIAKGVGMAAKAVNTIPAVASVTEPIGKQLTKVTDAFRPYAGLGREKGVESQLAGRHIDQSKADADARARTILDPIWKGLTKEERIEVERRSENTSRFGIKNPPRPVVSGTVPDAELTKRARMYRNALMQLDRTQLRGGVASKDRMLASREYTPRWSKDAYKTLLMDPAHIPDEIKDLIERPGAAIGGENRSYQAGTLAKGKHKTYQSYDEAEASGLLHENYDPATNALAHFRQRLTNVGLQHNLKAFGPLDQLRPLDYGVHGLGKAGAEELAKAGESIGASQASAQLRGAMNLPKRFGRASLPAMLRGGLREAEIAKQQSGVMAGAATRGEQAVGQRAHEALWDQVQRQQKMVDSLNERIKKAKVYTARNAGQASANALAAMVDQRDKLAAQVEKMRGAVQAQAEQTLGSPQKPSPNAPLHAASKAYEEAAAKHGVSSPEAEAAFQATQGMERVQEPRAQIYAPVVGRLQELEKSVMASMPPSKERAALLAQFKSLGERALKAPTKTADAAERHGKALLKSAVSAMGAAARATKDPSAQRILTEMEAQIGTMGREVGKSHAAGIRQVARLTDAAKVVSRRVFAGDARAQKRVDDLTQRLVHANYDAKQKEDYLKLFYPLKQELASKYISNAQLTAEQNAVKSGFVPTTDRRFLNTTLASVPIMKHSMVSAALADFLEKYGAKKEHADAISQVIETINKLTRIGIISNPIVHILWNLNNQFLGAGGHILDFMKIYNPRWHPSQALLDAARKDGAIMHQPPMMQGFGGLSYGKVLGARKDLNFLEQVSKYGTKAWEWNNAFTFGTMEERFATLLYERNLRAGMSGPEAGIAVRKALGDYANVSRTGIESHLNKAMFFYPWLKTIIPFWAHSLVVRPQVALGPTEFARTSNLLSGDPNADKERPTAIHLGNDAQGNPSYFSYPGPQKILADLADAVLSLGEGPLKAMQAGEHVIQSHLRPDLALGYDVVNTIAKPPAEPEAPSFDILFDKSAPAQKQWEQFLRTAAERMIPLPIQIKQMFDFARQLPEKGDVGGDVGRGMAAAVVGGSAYDRPSPPREKALRGMRSRLDMMIGQLRKIGRDDLADALHERYEQQRERIMKGS